MSGWIQAAMQQNTNLGKNLFVPHVDDNQAALFDLKQFQIGVSKYSYVNFYIWESPVHTHAHEVYYICLPMNVRMYACMCDSVLTKAFTMVTKV